ncbi:10432_t:CDS:2 [Scutellospora calospora]|uniref:10432_t:CDS:1 n=1 Tax=Scutellospora calospora TaxID=85575 RepID=A0ACA9LCQ6_9GLOM|nr:10432_t:CDS:2 [Scutellospora calospora]
MDNEYNNVPIVYSIFPSVNTSSIQSQSIINSDTIISTSPCAGSFMLPSPKYGVKQLNSFIPYQNTQQPLLIQQPDAAASLLYHTQQLDVSTLPVNISKQQFSSSIYPLNGFKLECSDEYNDSMAVIQEDAIDFKVHSISVANPYISGYPPTPTTPRNEILLPMSPPAENPTVLYDQGHYFLHVLKPRDPFQAFKSFMAAAKLGSQRAKHQVAYCYQHGIGVNNLYLLLAERDDPQGMKLAGDCNYIGIGTPKDIQKALEWYRRSSKYDFYWGGKFQYALVLYKRAISTLESGYHDNATPLFVEVFHLILQICENFPNCPGPIKLKLGIFYHFGIGCPKDFQKALYWYERASKGLLMSMPSIQECDSLINDIHQGYDSSLSTVIKNELLIFDGGF